MKLATSNNGILIFWMVETKYILSSYVFVINYKK